MSESRFPHLFSPFTIKNVELRNRVAISAHFAGWWVTDGLPNEDFAAYIEERAKGGVGLFVIGATGPSHEAAPSWMVNDSDEIIPCYRMLVEAGHRHGMKIFAQLIHQGDPSPPRPRERIRIGMELPEAQPLPHSRQQPSERSVEELHQLAGMFGQAAARARAGGVDGLELHAHEGFMHAQFLSPVWNQRTDEYGGSLENRMRFVVETLQAMREAIGDDLPLGVRLKADDQDKGWMTVEDYVELVTALEPMGLVDYISLTAGDGAFHHGPMTRPDGEWLPFVDQIKQNPGLPVMHAGRITTPEMAEEALASGKLDVVCMTKTHIADPQFTLKVKEGRLEDIRLCTRCLQSCIGNSEHMSCVYNPTVSRERTWSELKPAEVMKRVVIIGAGPAGMEAALVAHARGHEVTVLEKCDQVGGQVPLASSSPLRRMFIRIAEFYQRQAEKAEFEIRLSTEASIELVLSMAADAVVVATGSRQRNIEVEGSGEVWTVADALRREVSDLQKVLVIDRTGSMHALMMCDFLSAKKIAVEFFTPMADTSTGVDSLTREEMLWRLRDRGVEFSHQQELVYWDGETARIRHHQSAGDRALDGIDAVIVSAGADPVNKLSLELQCLVNEIYAIGDANLPRTVQEATIQGGLVGRQL